MEVMGFGVPHRQNDRNNPPGTQGKSKYPARLIRHSTRFHTGGADLMSTTTTAGAAPAWIDQESVCDRLGISRNGVAILEQKRLITVVRVPHTRPRYLLADIEALLAESTRPRETRTSKDKGPSKRP
jgi:hypothetical protein